MTRLQVVLADVPTDVLVHLVDHGPCSASEVVAAVAPADVANPLVAVHRAVALLMEMGWADARVQVRQPGPRQYAATDAGREAVDKARGARYCEHGCGCRYGTADPDQRDCACEGPCAMADPAEWGCNPALGGCGGDCPTCPAAR